MLNSCTPPDSPKTTVWGFFAAVWSWTTKSRVCKVCEKICWFYLSLGSPATEASLGMKPKHPYASNDPVVWSSKITWTTSQSPLARREKIGWVKNGWGVDPWRIIPGWSKLLIAMGIVSPLTGVIPLLNGLFMAYYLLTGMMLHTSGQCVYVGSDGPTTDAATSKLSIFQNGRLDHGSHWISPAGWNRLDVIHPKWYAKKWRLIGKFCWWFQPIWKILVKMVIFPK